MGNGAAIGNTDAANRLSAQGDAGPGFNEVLVYIRYQVAIFSASQAGTDHPFQGFLNGSSQSVVAWEISQLERTNMT